MDFSGSPKYQKAADREVTGISRRGRVRKKSSKLMDFESDDDVTEMQKKNKSQQHLSAQKSNDQFDMPGTSGQSFKHGEKNGKKLSTKSHSSKKKAQLEAPDTESESSQLDSEDAEGLNYDESLSNESESEGDTLTIDEEGTGFKKLEPLYTPDKKGKNKKMNIKNGRITGGAKTQRKDKGKPRFTAYMLWSKDIRPKLTEQYPNMDFATISKRLGEIWATVPSLEKCLWARRAKRQVVNSMSPFALKNEHMWKVPTPTLPNKFINKSRRSLIGFRENREENLQNQELSMTPKKKKLVVPSTVKNLPISPSTSLEDDDSEMKRSVEKETSKTVGMKPIDVAAHLTLLGESMTMIGDLLTNHNGNISIPGSLSILLDSFLCAMSSLMCLTQEVPESNGAEPKILSNMLNNIAYIMPGV